MVAIGIGEAVRLRAAGRCEYCQQPEAPAGYRHCIDHVIARQHHGSNDWSNLALCCTRCNLAKGPNLAGLDPDTGLLTRLYHPRLDRWADHFAFYGSRLVGTTPVRQATADVLDVNADLRLAARQALLDEGVRLTPD